MTKSNNAERAAWNRHLRRVTSKTEGKLRNLCRREFARASENWNVGKHEANLRDILSQSYQEISEASYATAQKMLKAQSLRSDTAKITWAQRIAEWIVSFAGERARQIAQSSQRIVTETIAAAAKEGLSSASIGSRIKEALTGRVSMSRAKAIARTEVGAAQNMAVQEAAKVSGIKYVQVWCSAEDANTRPSHMAADGQTRSDGELFDVGGALLVRPSDPNGPADEVINCRCTLLIEPILASDGGAIFGEGE